MALAYHLLVDKIHHVFSFVLVPFLNQDVHEEKSEPRRCGTTSTVWSGVAYSTAPDDAKATDEVNA